MEFHSELVARAANTCEKENAKSLRKLTLILTQIKAPNV